MAIRIAFRVTPLQRFNDTPLVALSSSSCLRATDGNNLMCSRRAPPEARVGAGRHIGQVISLRVVSRSAKVVGALLRRSENAWEQLAQRSSKNRQAGADDSEVGFDQRPHATLDKVVGYVFFVLERVLYRRRSKDGCDGDTEQHVSLEMHCTMDTHKPPKRKTPQSISLSRIFI